MIAPATQSDIGELALLGRSKVNTSLKALESRGLIRRRYGAIEVADAAGLRKFVHGGACEPGRPVRLRKPGPRFWRNIRDHVYLGRCLVVSGAELAHADAYEGGAYERVKAPLSSGLEEWVYVGARGEPAQT